MLGIALAAHVISLLTNTPFAKYVQRNVFAPLGMKFTTMDISDPEDLVHSHRASGALNLARGHIKQPDGSWKVEDEIYLRAFAAGNVATTAEDMARYMKFHLNVATNDQVLTSDDVKLMQLPHFKNHEGLRASSGITWQIFKVSDEATLISHQGDFLYAKSFCGIVPEKKIGLFFNIPRTDNSDTMWVENYSAAINPLQLEC